jgi:cytochrome c oxidase subunit 2
MPERMGRAKGGAAFSSVSRYRLGLLAALTIISGCAGKQSTFSTFGIEAEETRILTLTMAVGVAVITLGMGLIVLRAVRAPAGALDHEAGMRLILWLGAIGPTVLLTVLLIFSLPNMRGLDAAPGDLRISVDGEQFWWRVRYLQPNGASIETANEVRVPVGRTVVFALASPDVIHSFWIPGLAGKVDMIPGRTNELVARATKPGVYRGACTEFCGLGHARMAFDVVAMEPAEFDQWLERTALPAAEMRDRGRELFENHGCGGCHTIRGHVAQSKIGPDLTHFGALRSVGAGTLPMTREAVINFIRDPAAIKPGALMPAFKSIPADDVEAIADYLAELL